MWVDTLLIFFGCAVVVAFTLEADDLKAAVDPGLEVDETEECLVLALIFDD